MQLMVAAVLQSSVKNFCLKTELLKWRPDYDIACDQKAATCYRNAKSFDQCKECLMKAAKCHMQNRSLFHAAKCFEQAVLILKGQNNFGEIESLAHRACRLYQQQGSPEAAASALDKAAKIIENIHPVQNKRSIYISTLLKSLCRSVSEGMGRCDRSEIIPDKELAMLRKYLELWFD